MFVVAFKMLIGNRAAFIGAIFGIFLAVLLISQQSAIFLGLLSRSYRIVTAISQPDIWIIDPSTRGEDLIRSMPKSYLSYVKNVQNVEWAVPIDYLQLPAASPSGIYKLAEVYGIDDETLIGAPILIEGNIQDLHRSGGVIIDTISANGFLAKSLPDGTKVPAKLHDTFEINGQRAVIIGIGKITQGFYPQPVIFTTTSQFQKYSGSNRLEYIIAKTRKNADVNQVIQEINAYKQVLAMTDRQFASRVENHFLKTGILINFGLSVGLGLIIGFSIAGQIFYIMTIHNLNYYALIKALGGGEKMIVQMIFFQAFIVGIIGFLLGTAVTLLWGFAITNTTLAFEFPWQLLGLTGSLTLIICLFTALLSIKKVFRLDPQILMNV